MWTETTTHYTYEIKRPDGTKLIEAHVDQMHPSLKWAWCVVVYGPSSGTPAHWQHAIITLRGEGFETPADAQTASEGVMKLASDLVKHGTKFAQCEIQTDKINMYDHVTESCLICGTSPSRQGRCLHPPEQVRMAFSLALRLGSHVPKAL